MPTSRYARVAPTTIEDIFWLYACHPDIDPGSSPSPEGGKWLLFVPVSDVDEVWIKIRDAVEAGQLGSFAKVATSKPNPNEDRPGRTNPRRVICVYTEADQADQDRVRDALRVLGFGGKIAYKSNDATRSGRYRAKGDQGISERFE